MPAKFKAIGLIGKYANTDTSDSLQRIANFLSGKGIQVLLDQSTAAAVEVEGTEARSREEIGRLADLVVVVGGDGTLLNAARSLAYSGTPLIGVNLGRLGFLTDISPTNMEHALDDVLAGNYMVEERIMLQAEIIREGVVISQNIAFNDVVVHKWEEARMLEFETYINDGYVNTQRSDGVIISTPTGSTAYSLSGGGPILHPTLDAITMVPICPHTLSQRPLCVGGDSVIDISISELGHGSAQVTCDGQINLGVAIGDRIRIRRADHKIKLMHPADYNYYELLSAKLRWGERL